MNLNIELPDKPSELIRLALADLRKCEASPIYEINMGDWHEPQIRDHTCSVCLAGSVLAQTFKLEPTDEAYASDEGCFKFIKKDDDEERISVRNTDKLLALDYFRTGSINRALNILSLYRPANLDWNKEVTRYKDNKEQFHIDMNNLATELEKVGL